MHPSVKAFAQFAVIPLLLIGYASATAADEGDTRLNAAATYHYDAMRTGWDRQEQTLSAASFPATFGVQQVVTLDDQVDGQPLYVAHQRINGKSHDVVYVATEGNTVYALDAASGAVLAQRNLGPPVPLPLGCNNNGPNVGINSTPVIDLGAQRMYVIAYINGAAPTYQIFALRLDTLADAVPAVTVTATHRLTDGSTYSFNATVQRQRPGLLEQGGVVYAGFGSFCDFAGSQSRGWILGWSAADLTPLPSNELTDSQASSPSNFFLTSVWMSGYGLASNGNGVFAATGNSDCNLGVTPELCPPQSTYDGVTNVQESVIALTPSLSGLQGIFTPANVFQLDQLDLDVGGGGVLLLPPQPNGAHLATAGGKDGRLFLLDQNALSSALDVHQLAAGCWCGETYYTGADGVGRVVSSAGPLQVWRVVTHGKPRLALESTTMMPQSAQDPGFFTVVSSNGLTAGTAIIWGVLRPTSSTSPQLTLVAFAAAPVHGQLPQLFSGAAGPWPNLGGNANTVPLVANGRVYVAADGTLTIFGAPGGAAPAQNAQVVMNSTAGMRLVTGQLLMVDGSNLTLLTRTGQSLHIDASGAIRNERSAELVVGRAYTVVAPRGAKSTPWRALSITRAKPAEAAWPADH